MRRLTYVLLGIYIALLSYALIDLQVRLEKGDQHQHAINMATRRVVNLAHYRIIDNRKLISAVLSDFGVRLSIIEGTRKQELSNDMTIKRKPGD